MTVLMTYASKHGATEEIAERIGAQLRAAGLAVTVAPVTAVDDLSTYAAVVLGSAVYFGSWRTEATDFVRRHRAALAQRPVWLFSSGPLGTAPTDAEGHDLRASAVPKELPELEEAVAPRDHEVFFGKIDPDHLDLGERLLRLLPAGRQLIPAGDFRDWSAIDAWAAQIATALSAPSAAPPPAEPPPAAEPAR